MSFSIVCSDISFAWPDGTPVFDGFEFTAGAGRTGLIGANGSGKSTVLRLIAGELAPARGTISVAGQVGYLPQRLPLDTGRTVDEVLGVAGVRTALCAIEAGSVEQRHFDAVGDDWDVEERARAALDRLGLDQVDLDRRIGELSGGESVLLGLAGQILRRPDVLLLDEPTNNLDLVARRRLYDVVRTWDGVMLVVSHDRELLELVDQIADLRDGGLRYHGGTLSSYEAALEVEQEAARQAVRTAEADLRKQRRELIEAREKIDTRRKMGDRAMREKRQPMIVMRARKREAQVSAAKHRALHEDRQRRAEERLAAAEEEVRADDEIRVDLPATAVPRGRTVLVCEDVVGPYGLRYDDFELRGPERVALIGRNGSGKTTLLRMIAGALEPEEGTVKTPVPVRYLPQRLDLLDDVASLVENVRRFAPSASENAIRARLARFLFKGDRAGRPAGTLSGGERFRAVLAALLSAEPAPQLLLLDEPSNNLDMASVKQLEQALTAYRGALIVAAHDLPFLRSIGVTRWIEL